MTKAELFAILEEKHLQYNRPAFIESDPISVPHQFILKQDIEISGFLSATIAWGNRKSILRNARRLVQMMIVSSSYPHFKTSTGNTKALNHFSQP